MQIVASTHLGFVLLVLLTAKTCCMPSPIYSYRLYGTTYRISVGEDRLTGSAARAKCASEGASLADIRTDEAAAYLTEVILRSSVWSEHQGFFIAGHRLAGGRWRYEDGTKMTYHRWAFGYPVDNASNCVVTMASSGSHQWQNVACDGSVKRHYICARHRLRTFGHTLNGKSYYIERASDRAVRHVVVARERCAELGSRLVEIRSHAELQHLKTVIHSRYLLSDWWFYIGGWRDSGNGVWYYDSTSGREMTFANWVRGKTNRGDCAYLDPDYPTGDTFEVTPLGTKNYVTEECNPSFTSLYICSRNESVYLRVSDDFVDGVPVTWTCVSHTAKQHTQLEFVYDAGHGNEQHVHGYNRTSELLGETGLTRTTIEYTHVPRRNETGGRLYCRQIDETTVVKSEAFNVSLAYPPSNVSISAIATDGNITVDLGVVNSKATGVLNLVEGQSVALFIVTDDSFPVSQINVDFSLSLEGSRVVTADQWANGRGYSARVDYKFVPTRRDGGRVLVVRVTNDKFPGFCITRRFRVVVHFPADRLQLRLNKKWYREGEMLVATCADSGAYPQSRIEYRGLPSHGVGLAVLGPPIRNRSVHLDYASVTTKRVLKLRAAADLNGETLRCVATLQSRHLGDPMRQLIAARVLSVFYIKSHMSESRLVVPQPGNISVSIGAHPRWLRYNISDAANVPLVSGKTRVSDTNVAVVFVPECSLRSMRSLVFYNTFGQHVRIPIDYKRGESSKSSAGTVIPVVVVCGMLILLMVLLLVIRTCNCNVWPRLNVDFKLGETSGESGEVEAQTGRLEVQVPLKTSPEL